MKNEVSEDFGPKLDLSLVHCSPIIRDLAESIKVQVFGIESDPEYRWQEDVQ